MNLQRLLSVSSALLCGLCVAFKYYPSDAWHWTAPFVYVPSPFLVFWMLLHVLVVRQYRAIHILLIVFLLFFAGLREYTSACKQQITQGSLRVFHWNVWNNRMGFEKIVNTIALQNPDVVLLNEPKSSRKAKTYPPYAHALEKRTGNQWFFVSGNYAAIVSKYPMVGIEETNEKDFQSLFVIVRAAKPVRILLLDVSPSIRNSRKQSFLRIVALTERLRPDVIGGDLNTPSHAISLNPLRQRYADTGCGFSYTWPTILPMMRIDSILVRRDWNHVHHTQQFTFESDHAWQVIEIPSPTPSPPSPRRAL